MNYKIKDVSNFIKALHSSFHSTFTDYYLKNPNGETFSTNCREKNIIVLNDKIMINVYKLKQLYTTICDSDIIELIVENNIANSVIFYGKYFTIMIILDNHIVEFDLQHVKNSRLEMEKLEKK